MFLLIFLLLAVFWLYLLFALTGFDIPFLRVRQIPLAGALAAFGFSLAIICGLLWIGHQLKIIVLPPNREKGIWLALILAVISSVANGIANAIVDSTTSIVREELSGYWIEEHSREDDKQVCSIVQIKYSPQSRTYTMDSYAFQIHDGENGVRVDEYAAWHTIQESLEDDGGRLTISYHYKAVLYKNAPDQDGRRNPLLGEGRAVFTQANDRYSSGNGHYTNEQGETTALRYERIDESVYPQITEHKGGVEEGQEIVMKYWESRVRP